MNSRMQANRLHRIDRLRVASGQVRRLSFSIPRETASAEYMDATQARRRSGNSLRRDERMVDAVTRSNAIRCSLKASHFVGEPFPFLYDGLVDSRVPVEDTLQELLPILRFHQKKRRVCTKMGISCRRM